MAIGDETYGARGDTVTPSERDINRDSTRIGSRLRGRTSAWTAIGVALIAVSSAAPAFGEGSVDFNTGENTRHRNVLSVTRGGAPVFRVYARAGERIQLASSTLGLGGSGTIRVYHPGSDFASSSDPDEAAPLATDSIYDTQIFDCATDDPGTGRIASRAAELAGPAPNPGGFDACEFTAPADGIYPVVMYPHTFSGPTTASQTVGNPNTGTIQGTGIPIWDITVRDGGGNEQPGRVFAHQMSLSEGSSFQPAMAPNPAAFLLTPTGYLYRVKFYQHGGQVWELAANDRGVVDASTGERTFSSFKWGDTGNIQSYFDATAPQLTAPDLGLDDRYPLFFRTPDPIVTTGPGGLGSLRGYASAPISPTGALSDLSFTGIDGHAGETLQGTGGTISFVAPPQMAGQNYTLEVDLDGNGTFGDAEDLVKDGVRLDASGTNSVAWDGRNANGDVPACGTYAYRVRSTLAEIHLTQSDVENSGGTEIERLSLPGDPDLGDPFAASYNDVDPYKGLIITNSVPAAVHQGTSGPTFHKWSSSSGDMDFVDTWMRLPDVASSGTLRLLCPEDVPDLPGPDLPTTPTVSVPPLVAPLDAGSIVAASTSPKSATAPSAKPRLRVTKTANRSKVRAGGTVRYTIRVANPSKRAVRNIRICDRLPAGLVMTKRAAKSRLSKGQYCWTAKRLGAGKRVTYRLTVRVLPGARGRQVNRVTVSSRDVVTSRATRTIRVLARPAPAGGVTG